MGLGFSVRKKAEGYFARRTGRRNQSVSRTGRRTLCKEDRQEEPP